MKAYLINLDSAEDRLAQFDAQARTLGFPYQRVSAVDGRTPAYAEALGERSAGPVLGRVIRPTEVACFESHISVWRAIVDSGDEHGIALEDDVILKPGFERYVTPGWAPPEAGIVRLESWRRPMHLERANASRAHGRAMYRLQSNIMGTGAYAISAKCARYLLEHAAPIEDPIDITLFYPKSPLFAALNVYQMTPAPARQAQFVADYQAHSFAKSEIAAGRGQEEQLLDMAGQAPWWRIFPDAPNANFAETCALALWVLKERVKGLRKGTRFKFVPFG